MNEEKKQWFEEFLTKEIGVNTYTASRIISFVDGMVETSVSVEIREKIPTLGINVTEEIQLDDHMA